MLIIWPCSILPSFWSVARPLHCRHLLNQISLLGQFCFPAISTAIISSSSSIYFVWNGLASFSCLHTDLKYLNSMFLTLPGMWRLLFLLEWAWCQISWLLTYASDNVNRHIITISRFVLVDNISLFVSDCKWKDRSQLRNNISIVWLFVHHYVVVWWRNYAMLTAKEGFCLKPPL